MLCCGQCKKYMPFGGNDAAMGVCSLPTSYFAVEADMPCVYLGSSKRTCKMCSHYRNDAACLTAQEDDAACVGFEDQLDKGAVKMTFRLVKVPETVTIYAKPEDNVGELLKDALFREIEGERI